MSWEYEKIGNVFLLIRNGASIKQSDGAKGVPITRIETISNQVINKERLGYANINDDSFSEYYLKNEDILMSHINSLSHLGKCAIAENINEKIIHGMNLLLLRANEKRLFSKYAWHYFNSPKFKKNVIKISNQSVNQCSFSLNKLKELQIPLPPLPIQKRIAAILDAADALRRKDQELLKKYDELAQAIFIDMFGDPVKNERGWEERKIKEIVSKDKHAIKAGPFGSSLKKEFYTDSGFKIYGQEQVIADDLTIGNYYINKDRYNLLKSCAVDEGDVLISLVGTYGKISVVPKGFEKGIINPRLMKISVDKNTYNPYFLKYLLQTNQMYDRISRFSRGGTMDIVNVGIVSEVLVIVPPLTKQENFVDVFNDLQMAKGKIKSDNANVLFASLLQKAFKGELVKEEELV